MAAITTVMNRSFLGAVALFAGLAFATSAAGASETCEADTCPAGFVCEIAQLPCAEIARVCAEGEDCNTDCPSETTTTCVRAACDSDEDCGTDMVCAEQTSWDCADVAAPCAEGEECDVVGESTCEEVVRSECTPRWELPCAAASDCGAGFECVEWVNEWCSAGGSEGATRPGATSGSSTGADTGDGATDAPASDGTDAADSTDDGSVSPPDVEDPICSSEPTGEFYCKPIETACEDDSDCLEGWTCIDNPNGVCWADSEGNSGCTTPDPAKLCQVPYSDHGVWGVAEHAGVGLGETTADANDDNGQGTAAVGGSPEPNEDGDVADSRDADDDDSTTIDDEDAADDSDDDDSATAMDGSDDDPDAVEASDTSKPNSGGCSVQPINGGLAGGLSGILLGMALAIASRRRR